MSEPEESPLELMFSLFEGLPMKAPGSPASTLRALSMLPEAPARLVDFGCGAGASSLALAGATEAAVTAVDIHPPFLDELEKHAQRAGLADRIQTVAADMGEPPFPDQSFDVVWSEGAIYNIGFEAGLTRWRPLLTSAGSVAVTEITWLTENPPQPALEFWSADYPDMTSIDDNLTRMRAAGFLPLGHFTLPLADWESYYGPLEERLTAFRGANSENSTAQAIADSMQHEIDIWKEFGSSYGYVFYLGQVS